MKSLTCLAATALALCAFTYGANAATVTDSTMPIGPDVNLQPNSVSGTGNFNGAQLGSVGDKTTSPYDNSTSFYSVLDYGGSTTGPEESALFVVPTAGGATTLDMLWGTPDSYNSLSFYTSNNGTGTAIQTFTGTQIAALLGVKTGVNGTSSIQFLSSVDFGSFVLLDNPGQAAFEYSVSSISGGGSTSTTPLPAALPLFAGGLGLIGMLSRRRKQKGSAALAA
jgi:hypothetical protein